VRKLEANRANGSNSGFNKPQAAHLLAGHASDKLSFMAEFLGKDKLPAARDADRRSNGTDSPAHLTNRRATAPSAPVIR
jgi:hypothetical protein